MGLILSGFSARRTTTLVSGVVEVVESDLQEKKENRIDVTAIEAK